jgi:hypothetical protein
MEVANADSEWQICETANLDASVCIRKTASKERRAANLIQSRPGIAILS